MLPSRGYSFVNLSGEHFHGLEFFAHFVAGFALVDNNPWFDAGEVEAIDSHIHVGLCRAIFQYAFDGFAGFGDGDALVAFQVLGEGVVPVDFCGGVAHFSPCRMQLLAV